MQILATQVSMSAMHCTQWRVVQRSCQGSRNLRACEGAVQLHLEESPLKLVFMTVTEFFCHVMIARSGAMRCMMHRPCCHADSAFSYGAQCCCA